MRRLAWLLSAASAIWWQLFTARTEIFESIACVCFSDYQLTTFAIAFNLPKDALRGSSIQGSTCTFSLPGLSKHLHFKYTQSQCHSSQHHSMARGELQPLRRSLAWRLSSSVVMGLTGAISRAFLYGLNDVQTEGLKPFLKLLDERQGGNRRQGLITVSNHISVLDDPVTWGVLPLKYAFKPRNLRWGLGAHDICFKN
ncbi:Lysophosphatidylcholine acyltransferase like protein [Verticillium longisporum]|nr:Lysophosphatidylcholine acyltransferase like protein [Verticillium longisporum]